MKKVAIVNGGGDCAGLNAVIESIVKSGSKQEMQFLGVIGSTEGLIGNPEYIELTTEMVDDISATGGTILKTTNKGKFAAKVGSGDTREIPEEILDEVKSNVETLGIDSIIMIGGDGTLSGGVQLVDKGINLIGIPKTIDNDLCNVDKTFGFSTAVDFVSESLDRIHTTADSHGRIFFIETMGRNSGWIALYGGVAGNADIILTPEINFDYHKLLTRMRHNAKTQDYQIIVVAEGAKAVSGQTHVRQDHEENKEHLLGGVSQHVMGHIQSIMEPDEFEMRNVVLGHLQRGGAPNAEDRILAQQFGSEAVRAVLDEDYGKMVTMINGQLKRVPLEKACHEIKTITDSDSVYQLAQNLGIYLGVE